jgi:energy-coupling factor transport system permease protein
MAAAFSLYVPRYSGLHYLHPLTHLALTGFFLVCSLALPGIWTPYLVFLVGLLPLAVWGRVPTLFLGRVVKVVLPFAVSLVLVQGLFWQGGTPLIGLGPLSLKREGLIFAIQSTGRILLIVGSFVLFSTATRPDALMTALVERGVSARLSYIVLATLQIVPRFQNKASAILDSQQARGLEIEGSLLRRVRALLPLVVPLILGSLVEIEDRAIALEARAFNRAGPRTSLLVLTDNPWEQRLRWLLLFSAALVVVGRVALLLVLP